MIDFFKKRLNYFLGNCSILHFHQQCMNNGFPISFLVLGVVNIFNFIILIGAILVAIGCNSKTLHRFRLLNFYRQWGTMKTF